MGRSKGFVWLQCVGRVPQYKQTNEQGYRGSIKRQHSISTEDGNYYAPGLGGGEGRGRQHNIYNKKTVLDTLFGDRTLVIIQWQSLQASIRECARKATT